MSTKSTAFDESRIVALLKEATTRESAFSAIVREYDKALYWQIRRMVLSHDDANDLLQSTFLKAWTGIDTFRGNSRIYTWLYRIAINETLTFLSKSRNNTFSIDTPEGEIAHNLESDAYFEGDHADALFNEAIARLPDKQRLVFNMKYFDDMKYEEISEITGTSIGALKASYHIAVKKIEEFLEGKL